MYSCVEPEIGLPAADSGAQLALIDQFVACVDPPVSLQAVVWVNLAVQRLHLIGFSSVCILRWFFSLDRSTEV